MASSLPNASAIDDTEESTETTPTLEAKQKDNISLSTSLPDAALQGSRGEPDLEPNRMSFSSSVYQLGSVLYDRARGAMTTSNPSSVTGSEVDRKLPLDPASFYPTNPQQRETKHRTSLPLPPQT